MSRISAGILLYRYATGADPGVAAGAEPGAAAGAEPSAAGGQPSAAVDPRIEVLLGHPGGPFHAARDLDAWTIPKGLAEAGESLEEVARREFAEETGTPVPDGPLAALGSVVQKGGKVVHAWAAAGDLDPALAMSNDFLMEWPPGSGQTMLVPELDRVAWFPLDEARRRLKAAQVPFLDRLASLEGRSPADVAGDSTRGRVGQQSGLDPDLPQPEA